MRVSAPEKTRGLVIGIKRLLPDWAERMAAAGLTTLGIHGDPHKDVLDVIEFVESDEGQKLLDTCRALDVRVEYELHAMKYLLPREKFQEHPEWFRTDESGNRNPDANFCVSNEEALAAVADRAVELARRLPSTTGRYFLWPDDGPPWCRCPRCAHLSDSDQALIMTNAIAAALRERVDPQAQAAHLAYHNTLNAPAHERPGPGVFVEFAPIRRIHEIPIDADDAVQQSYVKALKENLAVFGSEGAQVLEYWLDVSWYSQYRRPPVKLPFDRSVLRRDVEFYSSLGIRHITTFAVDIDREYLELHGEPPIGEYAEELIRVQEGGTKAGQA